MSVCWSVGPNFLQGKEATLFMPIEHLLISGFMYLFVNELSDGIMYSYIIVFWIYGLKDLLRYEFMGLCFFYLEIYGFMDSWI